MEAIVTCYIAARGAEFTLIVVIPELLPARITRVIASKIMSICSGHNNVFILKDRKRLTERKLEMRVQMPDDNYRSYLEDVLALCKRAVKEMTESEKIQHILKGINQQAFIVLLMVKPTSVQEIAAEC